MFLLAASPKSEGAFVPSKLRSFSLRRSFHPEESRIVTSDTMSEGAPDVHSRYSSCSAFVRSSVCWRKSCTDVDTAHQKVPLNLVSAITSLRIALAYAIDKKMSRLSCKMTASIAYSGCCKAVLTRQDVVRLASLGRATTTRMATGRCF